MLRNQMVSDMSKHHFNLNLTKACDERLHPLLLTKNGKIMWNQTALAGRKDRKHNLHFTQQSDKEREHPAISPSQRCKWILDDHCKHACSVIVPILQHITIYTRSYQTIWDYAGMASLGELQNMGEFQTNWFAHTLWDYTKPSQFFCMQLMEQDLLCGAQVVNPLTIYIPNVQMFGMYLQPKVLSVLLTAMHEQQQMQEASPGETICKVVSQALRHKRQKYYNG